jgi:hypothetical protein
VWAPGCKMKHFDAPVEKSNITLQFACDSLSAVPFHGRVKGVEIGNSAEISVSYTSMEFGHSGGIFRLLSYPYLAKTSQLAHSLPIGGPAPIREMPKFAEVYAFIYSGLSLAIQSSSTSCELGSYSFAI